MVVAANFLIDAESNLKAVVGGFGSHGGHGGAAPGAAAAGPVAAAPPAAATAVGNKAQGTVDAVDLKAGTVSINHGAVASLKWPPMTMEFKAANAALLAGLKTGQPVSFEFVERQPGEYVVTSIIPAAPGTTSAAAAAPPPAAPPPARPAASSHSGH